MVIKIERIDSSLPLPEIKGDKLELYSREEIRIPRRAVTEIPTNIKMKVPQHYVLILKLTRDMWIRYGLRLLSGMAVYTGSTEEIVLQCDNRQWDFEPSIERGQVIAEGYLIHLSQFNWGDVSGVVE